MSEAINAYAELQLVNKLVHESLSHLDTVAGNLDESEELASILQELINRRQELLLQWLPDTTQDDVTLLTEQQKLSLTFEQCVANVRQRYANELALRKSNTSKVNLYKTFGCKQVGSYERLTPVLS